MVGFIYPDTFVPSVILGLSTFPVNPPCSTAWQQSELGELLSPPEILSQPLDSWGSNPSCNDNFTWEAMQSVTFPILTKGTGTL